MRRLVVAVLFALAVLPAAAAERWETLPPTPAPIPTDRSGETDANGIKIHYAIYGQGSPVILLHGGLANTDYWGNQVPAVAAHHTVILMDSRGHGRSTRDARPYGYDLMADDVVALMDALKIPKADIVGWSDGGILGTRPRAAPQGPRRQGVRLRRQHRDLGRRRGRREESDLRRLHRPRGPRIRRAFGDAQGIRRLRRPDQQDVGGPAQLDRRRSSRRSTRRSSSSTATTTRRSSARTPSTSPRPFPHAGLLILPNVSHFAFLQDPDQFNFAILHFLGDE